MIDLSIIILNYQTKEMTLDCLEAVRKSELGALTLEVIVVDNASQDDSRAAIETYIKEHKQGSIPIRLIKSTTNAGFAAGNNKGIREARGRYVLLLNSDAMVAKDTLKKQIEFMEVHQEYAVSTCRLLLKNGQLDWASHRGFPSPWASLTYFTKLERMFGKSYLFGQYHRGWEDLDVVHDVDVISGAFFFARRDVFEHVGLLDEGFFMYAEDIDLCFRIRQAGMRIGFYPVVTALHVKGASGRSKSGQPASGLKPKKAGYYFWDTMKLFYHKHYETKYPKPLMWLIFKVIDWKKKAYV